MNTLRTQNREQGTEALNQLLRQAVPPVEQSAEPMQDLWPAMRRRLAEQGSAASGIAAVPWFDWALAGGVAIMAVAFPAAIPVLLYYL